MIHIPKDLFEIIASFLHTSDIKNIIYVCKLHNRLINNSIFTGYIHDTKILLCWSCDRYLINPSFVYLNTLNNSKVKFPICSSKCKNKILCEFPRCNFCFTYIAHIDRLLHTLFCSNECIQHSQQRLPRERFIYYDSDSSNSST